MRLRRDRTAKPQPVTTRALVDELATGDPNEALTLGELLDRFSERSFGLFLLIVMLPTFIPIPVGVGGVSGALAVLIGLQFLVRLEHPWLPDDDFLILFNAHPTAVEMVIPSVLGGHWQIELDTDARATASNTPLAAGSSVELCSRSLQVYTRSLRRASLPPSA